MHLPSKHIDVRSVRLSLEDVRKIFRRLQQLVDAEGNREIAQIARPPDVTEEAHAQNLDTLRKQAFRITVTVTGKGGESLFGDDESIFTSENLPQYITSVFLTNITAYHGVSNKKPLNSFNLLLDFSKPPLLDANTFVSSPTPNNSNITVEGTNDAWVAAVVESVDGIIRHRKTTRPLVHRAFSYDAGLFFLGLPMAFYASFKLSGTIEALTATTHPVVGGALYIYIFLFVIYIYRILFGYSKWAFPTVELTDNRDKSTAHRWFWSAIVLALAGNFTWELLKFIGS